MMRLPAVVRTATPENLPHFLAFIDDVCARIDADDTTKYALRLAVEEVCTNLIVHGYKNHPAGPIKVDAIDQVDRVTLVIHDRAPPFDPKLAPPPDVTSDVEHRKPGGLGWHLVKKMIDEIRYVADTPEGNVLTLVKYKEPTIP
ncbi:MAG TPA: ATP-binding protein [Casimicrobiaceae bacterium]|nr:ATP-binding protein [Casimicrobiaceae bacterium]